MPFEQLIALLTFFGGGMTAIFAWLSKSYFPHRQKMQEVELAEQAKQREHERDLAKRTADEQDRGRQHERDLVTAKAQADLSEEGNIWQQMIQLQTKLMGQSEQFSDFIIHLATERATVTDQNARDDLEKAVGQWTTNAHELREVRASLVEMITEAKLDRADLKKIPDALLEFIARQEVFYGQVQKILGSSQAETASLKDAVEKVVKDQ